MKRACAFAPATIGNVSVGFDILGMAIRGAGDTAKIAKTSDGKVTIRSITLQNGRDPEKSESPISLPHSARQNTAGAAVLALQKMAKVSFGFQIELQKGIPIGSGMGGSAASAVAAVVAANRLLPKPLTMPQLFMCALAGEKKASGGMHPDNVAPCLYGGLTLSSLDITPSVIGLPFPSNLHWLLVHPDVKVETKTARGILSRDVALSQYVAQTARLSTFIAGFYERDLEWIRQGFQDRIIEPQRQHLIPGFKKIKSLSEKRPDILGLSISGSGPSVFAFTTSKESAQNFARKISDIFREKKLGSQIYIGKGRAPGARSWWES